MTLIVALAARGDGMAEDGSFHAGTAPGDTVLPDGRIAPGPHHTIPPCRHFGRCGGCQLQHVDDLSYAGFLTDRIVTALAAQGIAAPDMTAPHLSPPHARRRVSLTVERRGKAVFIGFSEASSHTLIDLAECTVMHPELFALVAPLRALMSKLVPDRKRAGVRMTLADQGIDMLLTGIEAEGLEATEALSDFAATHRLARLSVDEGYGPAARWEPEPVTIALGDVAVPLPEGAFLQATIDGERALVRAVQSAIGDCGPVADLFSGLGTFALSLGTSVHAVEGARDAILALQQAARQSGRSVAAEHRDLFRRPMSAHELSRFGAVVLDPPRAGAKEQAIELAASGVPTIAYVSCNPSTFARDAKALVDGGYRLEHIQPVGQFRWSTHVELAAHFRR